MQPKWILMKLILPFAENSIRPLSDTLLLLVIEYLVYAYVYLCILLLLLILLLILIMIHCSVLLNHRQILNTFSLVILKLKLTNFINILYKFYYSNIIWIRLKKYIFDFERFIDPILHDRIVKRNTERIFPRNKRKGKAIHANVIISATPFIN